MIPKVTLLAVFAILVFTVTPLSYRLFRYSSTLKKNESKQPSSAFDDLNQSASLPSTSVKKCDIFTGEWVPNPKAPYYTNKTCWAIHEHQNCMKYGRPDSEFMKWRWKPNGCELPIFNPFQFLEIVRGKSMAFVGDSVGRNQMQSMICLLSRVSLFHLIEGAILYIIFLIFFGLLFLILLFNQLYEKYFLYIKLNIRKYQGLSFSAELLKK